MTTRGRFTPGLRSARNRVMLCVRCCSRRRYKASLCCLRTVILAERTPEARIVSRLD